MNVSTSAMDSTQRGAPALRLGAALRFDRKFVFWGESALIDGLVGRKHSPFRPLAGPLSAAQAAKAKFKAIMRFKLWASACQSNTARALIIPRTLKRCKPRLRRCALVHSMLAARSL